MLTDQSIDRQNDRTTDRQNDRPTDKTTTVTFGACALRVNYYSFQNEKINSTREVGFHLSLKLKKRCIVGKKRATEVS